MDVDHRAARDHARNASSPSVPPERGDARHRRRARAPDELGGPLARRLERVGHERVGGEQIERRLARRRSRSSQQRRDEPLGRREQRLRRVVDVGEQFGSERRARAALAAPRGGGGLARVEPVARRSRRSRAAPRTTLGAAASAAAMRPRRESRPAPCAACRRRGRRPPRRRRARSRPRESRARAGRRSRRRAASLAVVEASPPSTPTPLPSCSRSASPSACSAFTSPTRTVAADEPRAVAAERLRRGDQRLQLVAAAAHRLLELLLERAALLEQAAARAARRASTGVAQRLRRPARSARSRSRSSSNAPGPVTASMRRTPAATPVSLTIRNSPISAVLRTCVPPHSSIETPGTSTTRTTSPYFSPNSAIAPVGDAPRRTASRVDAHRRRAPDLRDSRCASTSRELLRRHRAVVREVEAQPVGRDERARLVHVLAEHLAQRGVQQVRGRVVALGVAARARCGTRAVTRPERERRPSAVPIAADAAVDLAHVVHVDAPPVAHDLAVVGDLPARLGVERRLAQHAPRRGRPSSRRSADDLGLDLDRVVADERRLLARVRPGALPASRASPSASALDAELAATCAPPATACAARRARARSPAMSTV